MWATAVGPGTEQDSSTYVCAAQSLISHGAVYNCGNKWPMNHFPPLYPMILGVGTVSGAPPLTVARWVGAVSCAMSMILTGTILYAATSRVLIGLLGEISIIFVGDVAIRYLFAMSEGPFIAFMLLYIFCLWRATDEAGSAWLIVAGVAAAAACLTRYMGSSLLITGSTVLLYIGAGPVRTRILRMATFIAIGGSPLAVWLIRDRIETRSAIDRMFGWHPPDLAELALGCTTVARWVYPPVSRHSAPWVGLMLTVGGIVMLAAVLRSRPGPVHWILANLILTSAAFIMLARCFYDPLVRPHERMMAPILLASFILILLALDLKTATLRADFVWHWITLTLVLLFLFVNVRATAPILYESRVKGLGGTERYYADSDVVRWIRNLPADTVVYSDNSETIRLFTDHYAEPLPLLRDPLTQQPSRNFARYLATMQQAMRDRSGVIVYFFRVGHWAKGNLPTLADMPSVYHLSMKPVLRADQGIIYEARYAPP